MLPADEKEPFYRVPYELFGAGLQARADHRRGQRLGHGRRRCNIGVDHIDAVEIDPVIARLGREFHPEQPSPTRA